MNKKLALSLIVESDNRAEELTRLLKNVRPHVDAVFITGNNKPDEKIQQIAKDFDCQYSFLPWKKDFSEQRNFNFKQIHDAGYEFILWLDTDDTIDKPKALKELVKSWPEDVDLYVARYEYAKEYSYNALDQRRERVFHFDPTRMKWVGRVHEQLIAEEPSVGVHTNSFTVIHHSKNDEPETLIATGQRNLEILFEELKQQGDKPDPRTLIQIGRTYLGLGNFFQSKGEGGLDYIKQAVPYLEQYIPLSGWDEERYEAICMMGRCMELLGQLDLAEKFYYRGVMEMFNRTMAYEGLIRIYFQKHEWQKLIFWYETMSSIPEIQTNHFIQEIASKLFSTGFYVKALFLTGRFKEAWKIWQSVVKNYGKHPAVIEENPAMEQAYHEAIAVEGIAGLAGYFQRYEKTGLQNFFNVLPQDLKHHELVAKIRQMTIPPRQHDDNEITIFCGPIGLEEWGPPSIAKGIGGSEEAVVNMGRELTQLGYKVTVYNICGNLAGEYDGVTYKPFYEFNYRDTFNIYIAWRELNFCQKVKAKIKWLWLHDVPDPAMFTESRIKEVDKIMVLSEYHRSLLPNVPDEKIYVSRNGVDMRFFDQQVQRDPNLIVYTSSPERGLNEFLEIAKLVKKQVPEAKFEAYYGWQNNDAARGDDPEYLKWKTEINDKMIELKMPPYTRLSHRKIAAKMLEASIWLYPTTFPEISCIAAMKSQIAGSIPVVSNYAALVETVQHGTKLPVESETEVNIKLFVAAVVGWLKEPNKQEIIREDMMPWAREKFPWSSLASEWSEQWKKQKS